MVAIVDFQEQDFQCESLGISEFLSLVILFFKVFFFMWPLFKLFIEFITILLLFFVFWLLGCKAWGGIFTP